MAYGDGWLSRFLWKFGGRRRRSTTTISRIPEEIYYEILSRLPVKSLLRCKSVCKDWYALISTSQFVRKHHDLTVQRNNPNLMLKVYARDEFYSVGYDSLPSSSPVCEIIELAHPYRFSPPHYHWVGFLGSSCKGLIGIWFRDGRSDKNLFCLWNPATREFKELPESPIGLFSRSNLCIHGLGYDHKTDDYKLAIGVEVPGSIDATLVQVYTLASNSWKTEETIPYGFCYLEASGVLVNGNLHWLALGLNDNFILVSFDISDECFKELQLPREVQQNKKDPCLGVLQGCLCLLVSSYFNSHSEVWEMQDYGIQESWTKCYVITQESFMNEQKYFTLVQSYKKDEILLLGSDTLVLYDSKHGSARELRINSTPFRFAETYFESLVSLNSGTYVVGGRKRATEETLARKRFLSKMSNFFYFFM